MGTPRPEEKKTRVLLTGASGLVGSILRRQWGDRYFLRSADIRPLDSGTSFSGGDSIEQLPLRPAFEEFFQLDTSDLAQFVEACQGVDVVVHLAADASPSADFYGSLLDRNIKSTYNAFHAARQAGCQRVVYASSVNAVLGYEGAGRDGEASGTAWDVPVMPTNVYGATKCWGEALARVFSTPDNHGGQPTDGTLSCVCVRLGSPRWDPTTDMPAADKLSEPHWGLSARDCGHLFERCVEAKDVPFAIVAGVSRHAHIHPPHICPTPLPPCFLPKAHMGAVMVQRHVASWMDVDHTCSVLGYAPRDGTVHAPSAAKL
jgi:NAD+ dependent glucose-6-phosphate dehydrogenase